MVVACNLEVQLQHTRTWGVLQLELPPAGTGTHVQLEAGIDGRDLLAVVQLVGGDRARRDVVRQHVVQGRLVVGVQDVVPAVTWTSGVDEAGVACHGRADRQC